MALVTLRSMAASLFRLAMYRMISFWREGVSALNASPASRSASRALAQLGRHLERPVTRVELDLDLDALADAARRVGEHLHVDVEPPQPSEPHERLLIPVAIDRSADWDGPLVPTSRLEERPEDRLGHLDVGVAVDDLELAP